MMYRIIPLFVFLFYFSFPAAGQLALTRSGTPAVMDFDVPGNSACSGTLPWTDNVTIPNCYASIGTYGYSNGCNNTGAVHICGLNGETALGARASNSTPLIRWGVRMTNQTGETITHLLIRYRAEQWSSAQSEGLVNTVRFAYQTGAAPRVDLNTGNWTSEPALDITSFVSQAVCGGGTAAINGNDPAHSAVKTACIPVNLPAGHEIMLRWEEVNDRCNDHLLAVDDLEVIPVTGVSGYLVSNPVCLNDSLQIAVEPLLPGAVCSWSGPAGFVFSGDTAFIAPAAAAHSGAYELEVAIGGCGSWRDTLEVRIEMPSVYNFRDTICEGSSYFFGGKVLDTPGDYYDTLVNSRGCDSVLALELFVKPRPLPPHVSDTVFYCQLQVVHEPLVASGRELKWYTLNGEQLQGGNAPVPQTDTPGMVLFSVTQTIDGCESLPDTTVVVVRPARAAFKINPNPVCAGEPAEIVFTGDAGAASFSNWDWAGGVVHSGSGLGPYRVSWPEPGSYMVKMQLDNSGCISNIDSQQLTVRPLPIAVITGEREVCRDASLALRASGGADYSWGADGGDLRTGAAGQGVLEVSWAASGMKAVTLRITDMHGCRSDEIIHDIVVHELPDTRIQPRMAGQQVCIYDTLALAPVVTAADFRYYWSVLNYEGRIVGDNSGEVLALLARDYNPVVSLSITDGNNCTYTDTAFFTAEDCCNVYMPDAFSPNGDGKNDVFRAVARGNHRVFQLRVFDRWGALVFETLNDYQGWDGSYGGRPAEIGSYFYLVSYECEQSPRVMKGEVLLIR